MMEGLRALAAHYAQYGWFLVVWSIPLVAVLVAGVLSPGWISAETSSGVAEPESPGFWLTPAVALAAAALATFACGYACAVVSHEDLVGLDYAQLTAHRFVGMPIWADNGRFFPLALQEYNAISLLGKSATLYHAFSVIELGVVIVCVFRVLDATPAWFRCLAAMFLMVLPGFVQSFFGLMYPERDLVVLLGVWLVCLQSFSRTRSRAAFCGALISVQLMLYYKETAFVLICGFAGARLLMSGWGNALLLTRRGLVQFARDHATELGHLALCAVFLAVYAVAIAPRIDASYVNVRAAGASLAALESYARSDWLVDGLALALGWRLIARRTARQPLDALWDPLAAGAVAFALAYVKLGLVRDYYLAPADFVAVLYISRFGYDALRAQRPVAIAGFVMIAGWVFQQNVRDAAFYVASRKGFVAENVRLASFLETYAHAHERAGLSLFFPQAGGFQIMEFSAFLRYKGLRPAGPTAGGGGGTFIVKSAHRYPEDRCHPSQEFRCVFAAAPQPGDLVVLLPGRTVSDAELRSLRGAAHEVFHDRGEPTAIDRALRALAPADRMMEQPTGAYVFAY